MGIDRAYSRTHPDSVQQRRLGSNLVPMRDRHHPDRLHRTGGCRPPAFDVHRGHAGRFTENLPADWCPGENSGRNPGGFARPSPDAGSSASIVTVCRKASALPAGRCVSQAPSSTYRATCQSFPPRCGFLGEIAEQAARYGVDYRHAGHAPCSC